MIGRRVHVEGKARPVDHPCGDAGPARGGEMGLETVVAEAEFQCVARRKQQRIGAAGFLVGRDDELCADLSRRDHRIHIRHLQPGQVDRQHQKRIAELVEGHNLTP